jgi:outer membrane protein assembly factor BamB/calcineurin-like phosphoesterase family protein
MKKTSFLSCFLLLLCFLPRANAQSSFQFAFVSDTHVGSGTGAEDLRRTVQDINANNDLKFVVITGDITEFGADAELLLAKQILDSLNKPWHIIPGNHDANWSESGANSFRTIFGAETFAFTYGGILFAGTSSGPNMRMGPGQVPRENLVWLDSVLQHLPHAAMPIVYLNHYPQDSAQNNWYEAIDMLKQHNTQLILCGHGHSNHHYSFEGIPGVMGRSNLRAKDTVGGYNIVTFSQGTMSFQVRKPGIATLPAWTSVALQRLPFAADTTHYYRPSYAVNREYPQVKQVWQYKAKSDIGAGTALLHHLVIGTDTDGWIYALDSKTGRKQWAFRTGGKIYSTPAVEGDRLVVASTDRFIYCLSAKGQLLWKFATEKPNVASPVIRNNIAYIGSSDGHFRAIRMNNGSLLWDFAAVKGFVVDRPLIYGNNIYFGCWANDFYALDMATGKLTWKWNNGASNRMFSPATCYPVAAQGRLFIVAPDRYMTAFDAASGKVLWRRQMPTVRVRESMGLSADSSLVYVKTMEGEVYGIAVTGTDMELSWHAPVQLGYELCPSAIIEHRNLVFVPTHSGMVCAINRQQNLLQWKHKISNCLVNSIIPLGNNKVVVSTMDGSITCLQF